MAHYQTLVDNYDELPTYIQLCHVSLLIGVLQRGVLQVEYPLCHGSPCRMVSKGHNVLITNIESEILCVMCRVSR